MDIRTTTYAKGYQKFLCEKKDENGIDVVESGTFRIPERKQRMILNDEAVIIYLDDGSKGIAKCIDGDEYDESIGIKIAYLKAKIRSLMKELTELTNVRYDFHRRDRRNKKSD